MTTREQAMQWWNSINGTFQQRDFGIKYYPNRNGLTGREIEEIWRKEAKTENTYLNRLKEQYEKAKRLEKYPIMFKKLNTDYLAMRLFCLDTQLISFNEIEVMEDEVNTEINNQAIQDSVDLDSWSK